MLGPDNDLLHTVRLQDKRQRIEWALANTSLFGDFNCKTKTGIKTTSSSFVKLLLVAFRRGNGFRIDLYEIDSKNAESSGKAEFEKTLGNLLRGMLGEGAKPRFKDGWVYYE